MVLAPLPGTGGIFQWPEIQHLPTMLAPLRIYRWDRIRVRAAEIVRGSMRRRADHIRMKIIILRRPRHTFVGWKTGKSADMDGIYVPRIEKQE